MKQTSRIFNLSLAVTLAAGLAACSDSTGPDTLGAPQNVQVVFDQGAALITWSAVGGADAYSVERKLSGGAYAEIVDGVAGTEYSDADVAEGTTYYYRVFAQRGSERSGASSEVIFSIGLSQAVLSGTIGADVVRTLSADTTYILTGVVLVDSAGELRIPAGTLILGSVTVQPTALIVRKGGTLVADGTAAEPIVFTSANAPGARARGDWGGVVLNGRSICNFPAAECIGEGASGPYGGSVLDDSSGRMTYVRIEYAGYEVSFGNELNGLTLNGVGSGTELHHIQAHYGLDDGIEFFGGTVDLKYAVVTGASDDSFDYSTGWQGRGQFWIAQQDPNDADNGWEVDNNEENFNATPLTTPLIYNVTVVGKGPNGSGGLAGESTRGLLLRRGTGGNVYNAIVTGFGTSGLDIDNSETASRALTDTLVVANSIIFSNATNFDTDADGIDEEDIFLNVWAGNRVEDPLLADPFNLTSPDFRPQAGSPALSGFATPPNDGFFSAADFIGAVDPDGTPWYEGWITTDQN
jgi:hypothetical protein